jgi:hypothetical protein
VCKKFTVKDIMEILAKFGDDYKTTFRGPVMGGMIHVAWNNLYTNSMAVAHGAGAQMSFGDLKRDYANSLLLLDALATALTLKPRELRGLN